MPPATPFYPTAKLPPQVAFFVMCGTLKRGQKGVGVTDGVTDGVTQMRFLVVIQVWKRPENSQKCTKNTFSRGETTHLKTRITTRNI